jgi:sugar phosphate isomerase/epimerase
MRLGIFAKTFGGSSLGAVLDAVVASGVPAIQFNMALTGGTSLPADVPEGLAAWIRDSVRIRGLEMVAVSGTYNMAHPDASIRRNGLHALEGMIAAAPALGTSVVTLCTGSRDPDDMWRWHPDNAMPRAWVDMLSSVQAAVSVAAEHDVILGFEPEHGNVVADAAAARRLLDQIASPHLKVILDVANLIRPGELDRQGETMEQAFDLLGDEVVLAHAKDLLDDGIVVPAGRGRIDYELYVSLLRQAGYQGALVLHGLAEDEVKDSVAFLRRHLDPELAELG